MVKASLQSRSAEGRRHEERLLKVLKSTVAEYSKLIALLRARGVLMAKPNRLAS